MRIVSLLPSATEIVYALDLQDALCAVTSDCDYPPDVGGKAVVSTTALPDNAISPREIDHAVRDRVADDEPIYRLDRTLIQEIQPDLILAQDLCRVCAVPSGHVTQALEVIGCRADVISLDPHTIDDVIECIESVGTATGRERKARQLTSSLRERVGAVRTKSASVHAVPTLPLEWSEPPFTGGHWIPEMVKIAGGRDVLGLEGAPSRQTSWDEIAAAAPEVIVYMPCGYGLEDAYAQGRELYDLSAFADTPAVLTGRAFAVDGSSYFSRPGPRLVDGLEILAWILHPEVFPEPPPGRARRLRTG